jgi:ATP-dependent helicase HepA
MSSVTKTLPPVGADDVGSFVRTPALGIGRLVEVRPGIAQVRYFQAPGPSPYVDHEHRPIDVSVITLPAHTRAYLHDGRRWRIGRIDGRHPQDPLKYLVAFPNGEGAVLPVESFDVRWQLPIADPFVVLESVGGDSPIVYEARLNLLAEWSRQRAAATGAEGLVLGSVELHHHQLEVVRRVSSDPIKRYLLADEVGLGKTIEAAALIWQFLAHRPEGRVLVLAPDHLREQWAAELLQRFRTDDYHDAWLRIRSHSDEGTWPREPVDLLVIDEAHHVTRTGSLSPAARGRVAELAHTATELLLLSATPVRSNEAGFLDLLYLLDPEHYRPDQLEDFVRRVELRDHLALTCQALVSDIDEFDLSLYTEELTTLFPQDRMLATLLADAAGVDDARRPASVARVREHLSETYRLHHRLLRTRRTAEVGATFSVRGRKRAVPFIQHVADTSDGLRCELLDSVRIHLVAAAETGELALEGAIEVFRDVAQRCGSLSFALLPLIDSEIASGESSPLTAFRDLVERGVLPGWSSLILDIHQSHAAVVHGLVDVLAQATVARGSRSVLASAYTETVQAVADEMARRWGADRIATHLRIKSPDNNAEEVDRWMGDGPCSVLLLDAGAEEGINLQTADRLIHLDLPWESIRVEQRIGRCDRHADVALGPIPSSVVVYGDQPYAMGWLEYLTDGCGVFVRSVSSLQYVLSDTERAIQSAALTDGYEVIGAAASRQAEKLATEQKRIVAHDALDAVERSASNGQATADERLLASDDRPALTKALVSWLEGVGANLGWVSPGVMRIERKPRPQIPFDVELAIAPSMERSLALDRQVSVSRCLPVLRAGHPLVDTIATHLQHNDRGVAFALFRESPGQWPPMVVLRTDFLVSTQSDESFLAEASASGLRSWVDQLLRDVLPPLVETVVMTSDGAEVTHPVLCRPYDKRKGDRNLSSRPDLFEQLTTHVDWDATCIAAMQSANNLLAQRPTLVGRPISGAAELRRRVTQRIDRERSRELAGLQDTGANLARLEAAIPNRFQPHVDVLGCGVIFVGDPARLG